MSVVSKLDRMGGRRCEGVQTGWKVQVSARRLCERKNLTELRTGRNSSHATLHTSTWCRSTAGRSRLGTMALARPQRGEGIGSQRALQVGSTGRKRWRPKSEPSLLVVVAASEELERSASRHGPSLRSGRMRNA